MLRFTHIHLENWRNFARVDTDLQRRVFLVGPNASGKSNFLDVFRFLRDIAAVGGGRGFAFAVRDRGGVSRLRCLAARRYSDIAILVRIGTDETPSAWEYELRFGQDRAQRPIVKRERVSHQGEEVLFRSLKEESADPERLTQTHLEQVASNQAFRDVADFLQSIQYLHIVPQLVRDVNRSVGRKNDPYGGDFLEQIAGTPEKTRKAWLRRIQEALKVAVPQLEELKLERDPRDGTPHLKAKYQHWRPHGAWQSEGEFSDGTLRLMGLLWAVLEGRGPLLLEEPELSLHTEVIRYIPQMFAAMQRRTGRKIMASSHSSDLLRDPGIGLDEVLLLKPEDEGTAVRAAGEFDEIKALLEAGLSLDDAVMPHTRPEKARQLALFGD
jgi:predicted ATPase